MGGGHIAALTTSLRDRLRVRNPGIGSGIGGVRGFLSWWKRSLLAWLPRSWRTALGFERGRLLLDVHDGQLQVLLDDADGIRELAHLPALPAGESVAASVLPLLGTKLQELPRWLVLPANAALRRRLLLPAAAADRLRDVVGFEIDRQTPFTSETVAFDARLIGRREQDGQVDAELIAVPKATLAKAENALGDLDSTLAGIDVLDREGHTLGVNLLATSQRRSQSDPWARWNLLLAVVAVLATAALLWQLLDNRKRAAEAFEVTARAEIEKARAVAAQRQQAIDIVEGQAFLDRTRASRPTAVEVLDEMTRRLPDTTHIEKFALESDRITLIGRSSEASELVGKLEGSKLWRGPALTGALQPDARSGRDIFTLTAELAVAQTPPAAKGGPNAPAR